MTKKQQPKPIKKSAAKAAGIADTNPSKAFVDHVTAGLDYVTVGKSFKELGITKAAMKKLKQGKQMTLEQIAKQWPKPRR